MPAINFPRRVMRPGRGDELPKACKWCGRAIGRGEVFTVGYDLGKFAAICPGCLPPPGLGERPLELARED